MNSQGRNTNQINKYAAQRLRSKRIIIIAIMASIVFVVAYFAITAIVNANSDDTAPSRPIFFYMADWEKDVMKDEKYLALDRNVYFYDTRRNEKISISDENSADVSQDYKAGVELLRKYVRYAINGNHTAMNKLFSDAYFAAGYDAKEAFTMQQIYDICITNIRLSATEENGKTYQSYEFWLEYRIRENNGTFRNDVGSDGAKPEMFIITDRNGDVKIDAIIPYSTK